LLNVWTYQIKSERQSGGATVPGGTSNRFSMPSFAAAERNTTVAVVIPRVAVWWVSSTVS